MPTSLRLAKEFTLETIRLWRSSDRPACGGPALDPSGNRRIRTVASETNAWRQRTEAWQEARLG